MLELAKVHKIQYEWNSSVKCFANIGYTNSHDNAEKVETTWNRGYMGRGEIHMEVILVRNEKELEKLREKDGGPRYQPLAYEGEAKDWITVGCKFHLQSSEE